MAIDSIARGMAANAESGGGGGGGGSVDIEQGIGINITGDEVKKISNAGVTSISEGTENGTIAVTVAGKTTTQIPVYGLGSTAYKDDADFLSNTTKYAEASTKGGSATSAVKLDSSAGNTTQPVYFESGKPVTIDYTIETNVPKDAVFTDTTYEFTEGTTNGAFMVNGNAVSVHGLNDAAYKGVDTSVTDSTNLLTSGAVKTELENYAKKSDITNVYKYKGTLPAFENLPTTGMEIGDVYDIRESGMNYAWDGEKWDAMGSTFTFETMSIEDIDALFNK